MEECSGVLCCAGGECFGVFWSVVWGKHSVVSMIQGYQGRKSLEIIKFSVTWKIAMYKILAVYAIDTFSLLGTYSVQQKKKKLTFI